MDPRLIELVREFNERESNGFYKPPRRCLIFHSYRVHGIHTSGSRPGADHTDLYVLPKAAKRNGLLGFFWPDPDSTCSKCFRHPSGRLDDVLFSAHKRLRVDQDFAAEAKARSLPGFGSKG